GVSRPPTATGHRRRCGRGSASPSPSRPCEAPAGALHRLPAQPRRLGQAPCRLLLRLSARRAVPRAALPHLRLVRVIHRTAVREVPPRRPAASGLLPRLPGLGRPPDPQLALLELPLVAEPLPARRLPRLRPQHEDRRARRLPALPRAGPP